MRLTKAAPAKTKADLRELIKALGVVSRPVPSCFPSDEERQADEAKRAAALTKLAAYFDELLVAEFGEVASALGKNTRAGRRVA